MHSPIFYGVTFLFDTDMATQEQLLELLRGPEFRLGDRYPDILLILFVTLTYSGGIPVLIPCAAVGFWASYYIDWRVATCTTSEASSLVDLWCAVRGVSQGS